MKKPLERGRKRTRRREKDCGHSGSGKTVGYTYTKIWTDVETQTAIMREGGWPILRTLKQVHRIREVL